MPTLQQQLQPRARLPGEEEMSDAELIARLRDAPADGLGTENLCLEAADRIEELIEESGRRLALARSEGVARVEQFEQNEALTEQLTAARQDAKEAEAYAEELEKELNTCRMAQAVLDNTVADLEAKLAKAVEAMRRCRVWVENAANGDHPFPELAADDLRTLDAALKGESHD